MREIELHYSKANFVFDPLTTINHISTLHYNTTPSNHNNPISLNSQQTQGSDKNTLLFSETVLLAAIPQKIPFEGRERNCVCRRNNVAIFIARNPFPSNPGRDPFSGWQPARRQVFNYRGLKYHSRVFYSRLRRRVTRKTKGRRGTQQGAG